MSDESKTKADVSDPADSAERRRASVAEALALLPGAGGERFAKVLEHESLVVEIYAPRGRDPQQPHTRDELYVVVEGSGRFVNGGERHEFAPGDDEDARGGRSVGHAAARRARQTPAAAPRHAARADVSDTRRDGRRQLS